jgi:hypothetical protein
LQISRIELKQGDQVKEISPGVALTQDELEWLMAERVDVLVNGETSQRRAVAMLVAQMVNNPADRRRLRRARPELRDSLRTALADGADDADAAVADNCRSALAQLWPEQALPAP